MGIKHTEAAYAGFTGRSKQEFSASHTPDVVNELPSAVSTNDEQVKCHTIHIRRICGEHDDETHGNIRCLIQELNVEKSRHSNNDAAVIVGLLALASAVALSSVTFPGV